MGVRRRTTPVFLFNTEDECVVCEMRICYNEKTHVYFVFFFLVENGVFIFTLMIVQVARFTYVTTLCCVMIMKKKMSQSVFTLCADTSVRGYARLTEL